MKFSRFFLECRMPILTWDLKLIAITWLINMKNSLDKQSLTIKWISPPKEINSRLLNNRLSSSMKSKCLKLSSLITSLPKSNLISNSTISKSRVFLLKSMTKSLTKRLLTYSVDLANKESILLSWFEEWTYIVPSCWLFYLKLIIPILLYHHLS